jgi:hypothetical protein
MEKAVKTARRTSETRAKPVEGIDARTSTPTPALPPMPCTSPIAKAPLRVRTVRVRVRVEAELAPAAADEESEGEIDDEEADRGLRRLLHPLRKEAVEEDDRDPEGEQRRRMAEAPGKPQLPGTARGALPSARNERRHGSEVIRVGRVAETEKDSDGDDNPNGSAVGEGRDPLVETEHRITSCAAPSSRRRGR